MKNKLSKMLALLLAAGMTASLLAGCGSSNPAADTKEETTTPVSETTDTSENSGNEADGTDESAEPGGELHTASVKFLLQSGDPSFYDDYNDNPVVPYFEAMEWNVDGERWQLDLDLLTLPAGSESDTMNTLYATGEYYPVMPMSQTSETVASLYESGIILDLTDYIPKYMPNYMQWIEDHPEYAKRMTNYLDGEDRYVQIYPVNDGPEAPWCGWAYRRDWIVKYGKNPETGEAFTGGYTDADKTSWEDDVVFPSGGSDPVYISDWEWMLDIFATALEEENIEDGYAFQLYYAGDDSMGTLTSTFANGNSYYYMDKNGVAQYGLTSDGYRAYIQCMREWYEKGWTDQAFEENSSDLMFWNVDTTSVYAGKVGLFYTGIGQLGNTTATDEQPDVCLYGAAYPINDMYGDKSLQGYTPDCYYGNGMLGSTYVITEAIDEEALPVLLTALDYLYSREGGMLRTLGFNKEQAQEMDSDFYKEYNLYEDGAYWEEERDGETWLVRSSALNAVDNLSNGCSMIRLPGLGTRLHVDLGYDDVTNHAVEQYQLYPNSAMIAGDVTSRLNADQSAETSLNTTNIRTYVAVNVPDFITGRTDIDNDADWKAFCDGIEEFNPGLYCDYINEAMGNN